MPNSYLDTALVDKAIIFATKAHKNTGRKAKLTPYIIHPLEVLAICETMTNDYDILAASVLHDTLEDTDTTYEEIKEEFGTRVADIVLNESDNTLLGYKKDMDWKEKKLLAIKRLENASLDCKIVALSDKLSNIRAINRDYKQLGDKVWDRFHEKDPSLHKWRFNELVKALKDLNDTFAYQEFVALVNDTFKDVK
ncbi:MAG: HD domain-containing protein [Acholeplasmatales bacterium]|nr:HD domain-containing protein [Acholeplasmatales bacterium]